MSALPLHEVLGDFEDAVQNIKDQVKTAIVLTSRMLFRIRESGEGWYSSNILDDAVQNIKVQVGTSSNFEDVWQKIKAQVRGLLHIQRFSFIGDSVQ